MVYVWVTLMCTKIFRVDLVDLLDNELINII
jgi:hypothetical protein